MQPQPPPALLHALHNRPNHNSNSSNNNNVLLGVGPMKQQVTFGIDGRPSLGGGPGEELLSEDEARRRREQLNRRPSYRQILKDLETVGDKPMKRELDESVHHNPNPTGHHLTRGQNGTLGVLSTGNGHMDGGSSGPSAGANQSPYGSPLSASDGPSAGDEVGQAPLLTAAAGLATPNPLLSAAVAASLMLPGTVSSAGGDIIGGLKPLPASIAGGGSGVASTMAAADALSAAVSSAFSHGNDWKNSLLYSNHHGPGIGGLPLGGGGGLVAGSGGAGVSLANTPGSIDSSHSDNDDNNRKRQVRLLKNREAAKECRRKKKEYVKCLENRVGVLENQNKALIEELKTLKELYCRKEKSELP